MFNQQHLAHLHNQFHHIVGVLPVLASVSCVLVLLHPHTLWRGTFFDKGKPEKAWFSLNLNKHIFPGPVFPGVGLHRWQADHCYVWSPQVRRPATNSHSFGFFVVDKFTHSLGLFFGKVYSFFWIFFVEKFTPGVGWLRGPSLPWSPYILGGWTAQRSPSSGTGSNVRHFFNHLSFVVAVAIVFVGLVVANQIALFVSVHAQNDLQNLLQNRKNCIFWCTKQIVMYPPKNCDLPKMPLFEPHQSSVPLWGRVAFLSSFLRNWHPPGRSYCLLLFIILQISPGFCRARPTMDAMVTRYL